MYAVPTGAIRSSGAGLEMGFVGSGAGKLADAIGAAGAAAGAGGG